MITRRAILVRGIIQGVGFRPFVYRLATQLQIGGFVQNRTGDVLIEAEGPSSHLDQFLQELSTSYPPLAHIDEISWEPCPTRGETSFQILSSNEEIPRGFGDDLSETKPTRKQERSGDDLPETKPKRNQNQILISPDVATCDACLKELFDPNDRRYLYPFLNCTHCGPRLTIIHAAPYDRERTTMTNFSLCSACLAEYEDPRNRRFHAQPIACPECGPQLELWDAHGKPIHSDDLAPGTSNAPPDLTPSRSASEDSFTNPKPGSDPNTQSLLDAAIVALRQGKILAIKGLGGYHLVCDATNEMAVSELRRRKRRYEKPLAIMVRDLAAAELLCEINDAEKYLLLSPTRPIVLLHRKFWRRPVGAKTDKETQKVLTTTRRSKTDKETQYPEIQIAESVAPGNPTLGVMLPYTPLHELLMRCLPETPLVMTSGNRSDEPITYQDTDASDRLADIADFYLTSNRPIHIRCDDSVTRIVCGKEAPIRRSRGKAPTPLRLPRKCPRPILALGGQQKNTFALGTEWNALLSHHLGDLEHFEAYAAYRETVRHYEKLFDVRPEIIVRDLHPDYATTHYAREREEDANVLEVQHHHAHLASCMAEHGLTEPVIGVIFDGTGFGTDGTIWGGEFLIGDYRGFRRAAHLRPVPMPSGEMAIREPWRMALGFLIDSDEDKQWFEERVALARIDTLVQMIAPESHADRPTSKTMGHLQTKPTRKRRLNSPLTSSAGRLFDAVAALAGGHRTVSYEGQAAIELEWHACQVVRDIPYPFAVEPSTNSPTDDKPWIIDTRPLIRAVIHDAKRDVPLALVGRRFHSTLVDMIAQTCRRLREQTRIQKVVCSGGVFMNALLTEETHHELQQRGFEVFLHERVPANDGGLCLGQLAVAASLIGFDDDLSEQKPKTTHERF